MPTKKNKAEAAYEVDGRTFVWHPLDDDDERGNLAPIRIPMRVKLKVLRDLFGRDLDTEVQVEILERVVPGVGEVLDEMDVVEIDDMFKTWQLEYEKQSGASLGE